MRTVFGVMISLVLLATPAAAQVTEPTDKGIEEVAPADETVPARESAPVAPAPAANKEENEPETLFGEGKIDHGGYGGPQLKIGRVAARDAVFFGGKGGWIINHHLVIGGGGFGLTNQPSAPDRFQPRGGDRRTMNIGYGGGILEYFILPNKVVHGTVGVLVGGGGLNLRDRSANCHGDAEECMNDDVANDSFFIAEPEVGLEVNVVKFMRLGAGVSYRYVTGIGGIGFENDDLRGFNGTMTVRFGSF